MRILNRNKTSCYYALYQGREPRKNDAGLFNGTSKLLYSDPVLFQANVSAAKGETATRQFGEDEGYDRTIVCGLDVPVDEYSVLWIGIEPYKDGERTPWNYVVKKVARSINSVTIAVRQVSVSA